MKIRACDFGGKTCLVWALLATKCELHYGQVDTCEGHVTAAAAAAAAAAADDGDNVHDAYGDHDG